ncbi:MAG: hypothetical protein M0C28_38315 [Candidatus Moduliflexus flocculans]|nr:hypothetical protein [Candidatus Moduliflexus flocculans]
MRTASSPTTPRSRPTSRSWTRSRTGSSCSPSASPTLKKPIDHGRRSRPPENLAKLDRWNEITHKLRDPAR